MKLEQIVSILKEKSISLAEPGLLSGQMGVAIFMFHYARHTGDESYEDFGYELILSIQAKLNIYTPVAYATGSAGIGSGIEYLIQHQFLDADGNEALSEFDTKIFRELIIHTNREIGLYTGVGGWLRYFYFRIKEYKNQEDSIVILNNKHYLLHIIDYFYTIRNKGWVISDETLSLLYDLYELNLFPTKIEKLMCFYLGKDKIEAKEDITQRRQLLQEVCAIKQKREEKILYDFQNIEMNGSYGLNGLSGIGLSLLSKTDPSHKCFTELL